MTPETEARIVERIRRIEVAIIAIAQGAPYSIYQNDDGLIVNQPTEKE